MAHWSEPYCEGAMVEEVAGSNPVDTKYFNKPNQSQYLGATWQPVIGPRGTQSFANKIATCRHLIGPHATMSSLPRHLSYAQSAMPHHHHIGSRTVQSSPRHPLTSSVPCVTLLVVTRVTLGLVQLRAKNAKSA